MKRSELSVGQLVWYQEKPTASWRRAIVLDADPWRRSVVNKDSFIKRRTVYHKGGSGEGVAIAVGPYSDGGRWSPALAYLKQLRTQDDHQAKEAKSLEMQQLREAARAKRLASFKTSADVLGAFNPKLKSLTIWQDRVSLTIEQLEIIANAIKEAQ